MGANGPHKGDISIEAKRGTFLTRLDSKRIHSLRHPAQLHSAARRIGAARAIPAERVALPPSPGSLAAWDRSARTLAPRPAGRRRARRSIAALPDRPDLCRTAGQPDAPEHNGNPNRRFSNRQVESVQVLGSRLICERPAGPGV
jgi:hypothetical protein